MKSIRVYLQYPWKFPDSPYYKYLIDNPPQNIEYLNIHKQKGVIINKRFFWFSNFLKRNIRRFARALNLSISNAHLSSEGEYDLIHCCHCLSKNKNVPWIADIESEWQLYLGKRTKKVKEKIKKIFLDKNCEKIMPWTNATAKEMLKEFPEIKSKIEVIYPAVPLPKIKTKKHQGINLVFIARYFEAKGGSDAIEVFDYLTKKYDDIRAIVVSDVPTSILEKYSKNEKIRFYGPVAQKKLLEEIYPISDILVYPGYSDTFGFAYLEAMSFGIPIVTVDGFSRKEAINEGRTGFVIERPKMNWIKGCPRITKRGLLIKKLIEKTEMLIKNKKLRGKMSRNCIKEIRDGKFSIKERNRKLERIYREALE